MTIIHSPRLILSLLFALACATGTSPVLAQLTDISTVPLPTYSAPSSTDVKPNIFYVLDDSGSMAWDFMPDWACGSQTYDDSGCSSIGQTASSANTNEYWFRNSGYNGIYYNPAVSYVPPVAVNSSGVTVTTTYPGMSGVSTATGGNSSATSGSPNWSAVKNDAFGVQYASNSTTNLATSASNHAPTYFTFVAGEYCSAPVLESCIAASAPSASYPYPATVRWCNSSSLSTCKATFDTTYSYARAAAPSTATITVSGSSPTSTTVSSITVGGLQILSATTTSSSSTSTVASSIAANINACTFSTASPCAVLGYSATVSGSVVTIYAPTATTSTPAVTKGNSGTMSFAATAFAAGSVPGSNLRTVIDPSINSYAFPGTSTKAVTRTDCAGSTCTYKEEMSNYANWWTYYRTRMQMMKTSMSNAFATLDSSTDIGNGVSRFRVGWMTINNNTNSDFLNLGEFKTTQKQSWYTKLFAANPGSSTPLRIALATAGQLYGGKLNGSSLNGSTVTDPLQYSCQQNYTILSTDGFWNENSNPTKLDGSTAIGNQDGALPRPYYDGGSGSVQARSSNLQMATSQQTAQLGTLQTQTAALQSSTLTLQTQTYALQASTSIVTASTTAVLTSTSTLQGTVSKVLMQCPHSSGTCGTAPATGLANSNWTPVTACSSSTNNRCSVVTPSPTLVMNVGSSCNTSGSINGSSPYTANNTDGGYLYSSCAYTTATTPAALGTCTYQNKSASNPYTVTTATTCSYASSATTATPGSCTWQSKASATTNGTVWNNAVSCSYGTYSATAPAASCTAQTQGSATANGTTWNNAANCSYATGSGWQTAAGTCTPIAQSSSGTYNGPNAVSCQYAATTAQPVASCTAVAPSAAAPYTVKTATVCSYGAWSGWTPASSACTPAQSSGSSGAYLATATQCQYSFATTANTGTCSPAYAAGNYSNTSVYQNCATTTGTYTNVATCVPTATNGSGQATLCQYSGWSSWSNVSSCTYTAQSTASPYTVGTATECSITGSGGTSNTLADVAAYYYFTDLRNPDPTLGANATGTCTGPIIAPATTANNLCTDNVPQNGLDVATTQHMTTFTLGLGSQGEMVYSPTYWNDTSGDFYSVRSGATASPSTGVCSWQASGACNWPTPGSNLNTNIDDLWHAAINGHGAYFSASNPAAVASGLQSALNTISNVPRPGTAAAAASSNPNVSSTNNYVFSSSYKSVQWYGELIRQQISSTGVLGTQNWSAMTLLDCAVTPWSANTSYLSGSVYRQGTNCYTVNANYTSGSTFNSASNGTDGANISVVAADGAATTPIPVVAPVGRTLYTKGTSGLISFAWASLSSAQQAYFTLPAISGLSQFCSSGTTCLSSTAQNSTTIATGGAAGEALVKYLGGDRTYESTYFRQRNHVLGDIVSSEAAYEAAPLYLYGDANYSAYAAAQSSRAGVAYVAANDGMLHAFDAASGKENWAYIPSSVLPNLYQLADLNYSTQHQFLLDATPTVGDICPNAPGSNCSAAQWKTILVGGMNRGGKGYYALDVTNPGSPLLLWEFTNANMGYSYGNPKITKTQDGTWVVLVSSGYNNADGLGHLFVLNANSGALIRTISTTAGSAATPSGLSRLSSHVLSSMTDNTSIAAYGGDSFGNVWRFDINGNIGATGYDAQLLATLKDASGVAQPVTVMPLETSITRGSNTYPIVMVGTGRYLGTSDVSNTATQSFYALLDTYGTTSYGNPRTVGNNFVQQSLTSGTCPSGSPLTLCAPGQVVITSSSNAVNWATQNGWYIDFLTGGERDSTDPTLALGTLLFTTITPQASTVSACGGAAASTASYLYALNFLTGSAVSGAYNVAGISLGSGLVTRPVMIEQADGTVRALVRTSGGSSGSGTDLGSTIVVTPTVLATSAAGVRRVSWRELPTQ